MTWNLHAAPFAAQDPVAVNKEGAPVDAQVLLSIEFLQLDDVEQLAELLVLVADQLEWEALLGAEILMGFQAVARYPENQGVGCQEGLVMVAKPLTFGRAARGVVLWVKVQHDLLAGECFGADDLAAGCLRLEVRNGTIDFDGHVDSCTGPYGFCGRHGSISASRLSASAKSRNWSRSQLIWVPAGSVTVKVALSMVPPVCGAW